MYGGDGDSGNGDSDGGVSEEVGDGGGVSDGSG